MENIYKIKIRSNHDPRGLYPSERRYSASIVLGLSVVFVVLTFTASLMGTLIINKIQPNSTNSSENVTSSNDLFWASGTGEIVTATQGAENYTTTTTTTTTESEGSQRLENKVEKDATGTNLEANYVKIPNYISAGSFIMALGSAFASITGILAWNRWYIDHYILLFFLCSLFSTLTAAISFLLISITLYNLTFYYENLDVVSEESRINVISYSLAMNTIICSVLSFIWSVLSTKVSYKGMLNTYPDDTAVSKMGNVQVGAVRKGTRNCIIPPDIINHFPNTKLAEYLPQKENKNLPKSESNREYNERVNKFLTDNINTKENK